MGIADYMTEAIIREHYHRAITGSVLQIGRQTFEQTLPSMISMFSGYGLAVDFLLNPSIELDRRTLQVRQTGIPFISDRAFFGALGISEVHAVDHDDAEGADIIHDMNRPIGPELEGIADIILDGSTLDNVHDPAIALMNYNRMLRPGGRIFSVNAAKPDVHGAYTGMAPEWFLDYYAANEYADCQVYAQLNYSEGPIAFLALDYAWVLGQGHAPRISGHEGPAFAIVFAEKHGASTWNRAPTRARSRSGEEQAQWLAAVKRFATSERTTPGRIVSHFRTRRPDFSPPVGFVNALGTWPFS